MIKSELIDNIAKKIQKSHAQALTPFFIAYKRQI
jgi:hypothetical protein